MTEPARIVQAHVTDRDRRWEWMVETAKQIADENGCAWFRVSFDPKTMSCLIEAWNEQPEDCGEPRWGRDA